MGSREGFNANSNKYFFVLAHIGRDYILSQSKPAFKLFHNAKNPFTLTPSVKQISVLAQIGQDYCNTCVQCTCYTNCIIRDLVLKYVISELMK